MRNKEAVEGVKQNRPCFMAFHDRALPEIMWLVPISSRVDKFRRIEAHKIRRFGDCITLRFGEVLGKEAAFLIQNMCPATAEYLIEYRDKNDAPIHLNNRLVDDVTSAAKQAVVMLLHGHRVIFPDVERIYFTLAARIMNAGENAGEFDDLILKELVKEGLREGDLLVAFKERRTNIRPAVEAFLADTKAAVVAGEYATYEDVFNDGKIC